MYQSTIYKMCEERSASKKMHMLLDKAGCTDAWFLLQSSEPTVYGAALNMSIFKWNINALKGIMKELIFTWGTFPLEHNNTRKSDNDLEQAFDLDILKQPMKQFDYP